MTARLPLLFLAATSMVTLACANPLYKIPKSGAAPAIASESCDVVIQASYWQEGKEIWEAEKQCMKPRGAPLRQLAPSTWHIEGKVAAGLTSYWPPRRAFGDICTKGVKQKDECLWNGVFRDSAPPDFTITALNGSLGDFISLVRVFRNGALAYTWRPGATQDRELTIPGPSLTGWLEPFMAPIDIRFLPAGANIDDEVMKAQAERAQSPWLARFAMAAKAFAQDPGIVALGTDAQCLEWLAKKAIFAAQQLGGTSGTDPGDPPVAGCQAPAAKRTFDADDVRRTLSESVKARNEELANQIQEIGESYGTAIRTLAARIKLGVASARLPEGHTVAGTIGLVDDLTSSTTEAFSQALQMVDKARAEAHAIATDRERQAQDFAHMVEAIEAQGSLFHPMRLNPELASGEIAVKMHYADRFQWFALAPWHAISVRLTSNAGINDLSLANAIPVLDVVGFRWNFGTDARYLRMGFGMAYFRDEIAEKTSDNTLQKRDVFHAAGQLNLNIAGFNAGLGAVIGDNDQFARFQDRLRLLVGVDLVRLFTGQPTELL